MENSKDKNAPEKEESINKEEPIHHIPPVSMDELNDIKNDLEQTEVNSKVKKRSPLNEDPDDGPNSPLKPPAL